MEIKFLGYEAVLALTKLMNSGLSSKLGTLETAEAARKLEEARKINGVPFDGTQDIQIVAGEGEGPDLSDYYTKEETGQAIESATEKLWDPSEHLVLKENVHYGTQLPATGAPGQVFLLKVQ